MNKEYIYNLMKEKTFNCELKNDFVELPETWRCKFIKRAGTEAVPTHIVFWKKNDSKNKNFVATNRITVLGVLENAIGLKFNYGNTPYIATIKIK